MTCRLTSFLTRPTYDACCGHRRHPGRKHLVAPVCAKVQTSFGRKRAPASGGHYSDHDLARAFRRIGELPSRRSSSSKGPSESSRPVGKSCSGISQCRANRRKCIRCCSRSCGNSCSGISQRRANRSKFIRCCSRSCGIAERLRAHILCATRMARATGPIRR